MLLSLTPIKHRQGSQPGRHASRQKQRKAVPPAAKGIAPESLAAHGLVLIQNVGGIERPSHS
jgi:hypothetical protein